MKKQQLAALCLAAGLALTGITSPVSAAQTDAGISISADSISNPQTISAEENGAGTDSNSNSTNQNHHTDSTDTTISPEQADQTTPVITEKPTDTTNPTDPSEPTDPTEPSNPEKPDTTVKNGVCYDEDTDTWNIYKDGELAEACNGLYDTEEGWLYIVDGKFQKDYTGLAENGAGWWRIVDGKVDFSCNGLVDSEYGWWYLRGGRIDFEYTGLAENEYGWWYIENGGLYFNATGLAQNEYGWFYVRNSKVDFGFTGLANNEVGWWYVRNGQIDFSYNGHVKIDGKQYLVKGGQVSREAYIWPLDGYTRLSDTFGERICPFHGKEFHNGVDIPAPEGTNIMASASGVVTKATYSSSFGNNITIDHGNGVETMYLHCSALAVEEGDHVEQGQVIAYVGTTGSSTGNHLDFRFKIDGEYVDPLSMVQP